MQRSHCRDDAQRAAKDHTAAVRDRRTRLRDSKSLQVERACSPNDSRFRIVQEPDECHARQRHQRVVEPTGERASSGFARRRGSRRAPQRPEWRRPGGRASGTANCGAGRRRAVPDHSEHMVIPPTRARQSALNSQPSRPIAAEPRVLRNGVTSRRVQKAIVGQKRRADAKRPAVIAMSSQ